MTPTKPNVDEDGGGIAVDDDGVVEVRLAGVKLEVVASVILPLPLSGALPPKKADKRPPVREDLPGSSKELAMA